MTFAVTDKLANVPTLVILGCAAVVTVPAVVAAPLNAPINVVAYIAPLLVLATNAAFAVSLTFPVNALPNTRNALPEV